MIGIGGSFLSKHGGLKSQGEYLSELLKKNGYEVLNLTESKNKLKRLIDVYYNIRTNRKKLKIIILQVYGTKSIILEIFILYLAKKYNLKIISHIHGGSIPNIYARKKILFNYIFKNSNEIITPSHFLKNFLEKKGFDSKIINNFIEIEKYKKKERETIKPKLLWMRNFKEMYNPKMAITVVETLKDKINNVFLYMAGYDGGEKEAIIKLIKEKQLEKNVKLLSVLNQQQKQEYADKCDIYINTSQIDNAPVTIIEMMVFGLNIVSTDVGGIRYIIQNGKNGILVNKTNHQKMAEEILNLLNNQKRAKEIRIKAFQETEKYTDKNVIKRWAKIISITS